MSEPVTMMDFFAHLDYEELLSPPVLRYAEALLQGRIIGQRCPTCGLVYLPPKGYCPIDTIELGEEYDFIAADRGVVTNYTIVTPVQYYGQEETEPFVRASIALDGGGAVRLQNLLDITKDEVRVGLRVAAVWVPEDERTTDDVSNQGWGGGDAAIRGWRPTGEPDMAPGSYEDVMF